MANPVFGSFLVRILQYGPFPWKRSNRVFLFWSEAGISKILPEEAKKIEIFPKFQRKMKKTNILVLS